MATINTIIEDIKNVPTNRLEELHLFIKNLISKSKENENDSLLKEIQEAEEEFKNGKFKRITNEKELESFFESL